MKRPSGTSCAWLLAIHCCAANAQQLKLDSALNRHHFVKFGYTAIRPLGSTSDVQDATGPLVRYGDEATPGLDTNTAGTLLYLSSNIRADHPNDYQSVGLGSPRGVRAAVSGGGTPILTLGTWLDDEHTWSVETYVLGAPIRSTVRGAGRVGGEGTDAVNLDVIATSDQLGPMVFARYSFGSRYATWRPSLGLAGTYVAFFNTRSTPSLERFVGGDTTVRIRNAFGLGAVAGLEYRLGERWTISGMIGRMKMSTTAKVITRTDPAVVGRSLAVEQSAADVGANTLNAVKTIDGTNFLGPNGINTSQNGIPATLAGLAKAKTGDETNLGTYTRTMKVRVDPMIYNLSVGYDF